MSQPVVTVKNIARVVDIYECLKMGHAWYPVINKSGIFVGRVSSNFLIKLIEEEAWYEEPTSNALAEI